MYYTVTKISLILNMLVSKVFIYLGILHWYNADIIYTTKNNCEKYLNLCHVCLQHYNKLSFIHSKCILLAVLLEYYILYECFQINHRHLNTYIIKMNFGLSVMNVIRWVYMKTEKCSLIPHWSLVLADRKFRTIVPETCEI